MQALREWMKRRSFRWGLQVWALERPGWKCTAYAVTHQTTNSVTHPNNQLRGSSGQHHGEGRRGGGGTTSTKRQIPQLPDGNLEWGPGRTCSHLGTGLSSGSSLSGALRRCWLRPQNWGAGEHSSSPSPNPKAHSWGACPSTCSYILSPGAHGEPFYICIKTEAPSQKLIVDSLPGLCDLPTRTMYSNLNSSHFRGPLGDVCEERK